MIILVVLWTSEIDFRHTLRVLAYAIIDIILPAFI